MMHFVEEYISTKTRLHEGLLTFKQSKAFALLLVTDHITALMFSL